MPMQKVKVKSERTMSQRWKQRDWLFIWIKFLCIECILWRILTMKSMFDVAVMLKRETVNDVPVNNYELLNIQACSFNMFWNMGSTQSLMVSCKYWVVPLMSIRVSDYGYEMMYKAWCGLEEVPHCFLGSSIKFIGHTGLKTNYLDPNWVFPDCYSSLN